MRFLLLIPFSCVGFDGLADLGPISSGVIASSIKKWFASQHLALPSSPLALSIKCPLELRIPSYSPSEITLFINLLGYGLTIKLKPK